LQTAPGDNPNGGRSGLPMLAQPVELIQVFGTAAAPVEYVSFEGVTISHTAVEDAGVALGSSMQASAGLLGAPPPSSPLFPPLPHFLAHPQRHAVASCTASEQHA